MHHLDDLPIGAQQLHEELSEFVEVHCNCHYERTIYTLGVGAPPDVRCLNCEAIVGQTSSEWWEDLRMNTELATLYRESVGFFKVQKPEWEVFILNQQTQTPSVEPNDRLHHMLQMMPGHIVWRTAEAKESGQFCTHRFILVDDPEPNAVPKARCLLCRGMRELEDKELQVIEEAEQAGVVFLKWQERFEELSNLKAQGRRGRRKRKGTRTSKATGGVARGSSVPAGYIGIKAASEILGIEPKKLRRKVRSGAYPATKVGNKVYVKLD